MTKTEVIDRIVAFFNERWLPGDKAETFCRLLRDHLESCESSRLYVDYDPSDDLLPIIQDAGVECEGRFFSARGIFNGTKFGVWFDAARKTAEFKLGYATFGDTLRWS